MSGWNILESLLNWTSTSVSLAPMPRSSTLDKPHKYYPTLFGSYCHSELLVLLCCYSHCCGGTLFSRHRQGEGGGSGGGGGEEDLPGLMCCWLEFAAFC